MNTIHSKNISIIETSMFKFGIMIFEMTPASLMLHVDFIYSSINELSYSSGFHALFIYCSSQQLEMSKVGR